MWYNYVENKARKEATNIMRNIIVELYGHPVLFVITLLFILGFLGMTYEFILRLFGKPSDLHSVIVDAGKGEDFGTDDGIVKVNDAEPDPDDEFEEKEDEEDKDEEDNNPFKIY